ncbi:MAG: TetR/AcrR family transcriptional regulator [Bacteroidetes bacterium]|nr:TetR/AcrR family transcriptional regulator [Bacteroidota bacterium]
MKTNQKEHIADVALQLFASNGYDKTSIAMIAKKADVAQGLMYNFYSSKDDLLIEILNRGFEVIRLSMEAYTNEKDPKKAISKHIDSTFDLVEENKEYWKLFHSIRMQNTVKQFLEETYHTSLQLILTTLTQNFKKMKYPNPAVEAKIFFATIDGLVNHYLMNEEEFPLKKIKKHLIQKYTI